MKLQNGISATNCLGGTSTCERINNPIFVASILYIEIIKLLPQKENLVPTPGIGRENK